MRSGFSGHHRKALIRSLEARPALDRGRKADRPRQYGQEAVAALKAVWEASDRARQAAQTLSTGTGGGLVTARRVGPGPWDKESGGGDAYGHLLLFRVVRPGIFTDGLIEKVRGATGGLTESSPTEYRLLDRRIARDRDYRF